MQKTVFNDPDCKPKSYFYSCSECRVEVELTISPYPHGPKQPRFCPVCGFKSNKFKQY